MNNLNRRKEWWYKGKRTPARKEVKRAKLPQNHIRGIPTYRLSHLDNYYPCDIICNHRRKGETE